MLRKLVSRMTHLAILPLFLLVPALASAEGNVPTLDPWGDPDAGQIKAATCNACHGADGTGIQPDYPNLGGQHYEYLLDQMEKFRSGERSALLMTGQVERLSDEDLMDIAAFYASQPLVEGMAEGADLELGEAIYRGGIASRGVPACAACHSPTGAGNGPAKFPSLSGQNAGYVQQQLLAYRAGERQTDEALGATMRTAVQHMNDAEIEAVSAYVQGLH